MSLVADLQSILTHFRVRVAGRVNSGQLLTVDSHLQRLAAAAETDVQHAEAEAHAVLDELYSALHTTASGAAPVEPPAAAPAPAPAPAETPAAAAKPTGTSAA